ncbi:SDR family NAD(P)-dependent oxidoreductase [Nocardia sp. AB354]|uniref:SDR family NAD(P)-dependent oxidoreductase n=1 Tax=Nocardia sp. AB354 TaxID=3413283 RepID=UPI003C1BC31C
MPDVRQIPTPDAAPSPQDHMPSPPFPEQRQQHPGLESRMFPSPRYAAESYRPAGKLAGQRAVITGGDSGIGRAVALLFAREGADVAIAYLPAEQSDAEQVRREEELAPSYVFLASAADSGFITGETVAVTGGVVRTR